MESPSTKLTVCLALLLSIPGPAKAWTCQGPDLVIYDTSQTVPTQAEVLRQTSLNLAKTFGRLDQNEFIVFGEFQRNSVGRFLHETLLEDLRALYGAPSDTVEMPIETEFTYLRAYRFVGHRHVHGNLAPFSSATIDARVSISAEYEGLVDMLPKERLHVVGVLRSKEIGAGFELRTGFCPSYFAVSPALQADILRCYADGMC